MNKAIFLDRDGVINKLIPDVYVNHWGQFEFIPEALEGLKLLADTDYKIFVVSNQGGIGEGYADKDEVYEIFEHMKFDIENEHGARIDQVLFCPHTLDAGCCCRKPKPGMIYDLALRWEIDLSASWMIGDMDTDIKAGHNAGIPNLIKILDTEKFARLSKKVKLPADDLNRITFPSLEERWCKSLCKDLLMAAKSIIHKDEHIFDSSDHPEPEFGWLNIMMDDLVHSIREDKC